jgi:hypothetical protein
MHELCNAMLPVVSARKKDVKYIYVFLKKSSYVSFINFLVQLANLLQLIWIYTAKETTKENTIKY